MPSKRGILAFILILALLFDHLIFLFVYFGPSNLWFSNHNQPQDSTGKNSYESEAKRDPWKKPPCVGKCGKECTCGALLLMAFHGKVPQAYRSYGGKKHDKLLPRIIETIRISNPTLKITLVHDDYEKVKPFENLVNNTIFLDTSKLQQPWTEKIPALLLTPYDYTVYLDVDMVVCQNIMDYFQYLNNFDFALPRGRSDSDTLRGWLYEKGKKQSMYTKMFKRKQMKPIFAEIHIYTCVIFYRKSLDTLRVLNKAKWYNTPAKGRKYTADGTAIPMALFGETRTSFIHLPSHVLVTNRNNEIPTWLEDRVCIVHGAEPAMTCEYARSMIAPGLFSNAHGPLVTFAVDTTTTQVNFWKNISILVQGDKFLDKTDRARGIRNYSKKCTT